MKMQRTWERLGQFVPVETEEPEGDFFALLDALVGEWDDLNDDERNARIDNAARVKDPVAFACEGDEFAALPADEQIALIERRAVVARDVITAAASKRGTLAVEPAPEPEPVSVQPELIPADPEPVPVTDPTLPPIVASGDDPPEFDDDRWHAIIFVEGVTTNDGREAAPGAMSTRPLPLPFMYLTTKTYGHDGAQLGGSIENLVRDPDLANQLAEAGFLSLADGALLLIGEGSYADTPEGEELRGLINSQQLRFVSADTEILEAEEVYPMDGGDGILRMTRGNIIGATACPFPAFQQCVVAPASMSLFDAATQGMQDIPAPSTPEPAPVAIAAAGGPAIPPAAWFDDPHFGATDRDDGRLIEDPDHPGYYYCPLTISADGRVFGHAAAWHRDHIGYTGQRMRAPHSTSDYANFCTGTVVVDRDGTQDVLRCGVITMNTGHAPTSGPNASMAAAKRHYDDTGAQFAHIDIGEDAHGIWYSGVLFADVSDDDLRAFRAGGVSGDWRPIGNSSELVALLAVNVPGFPCPRPRRSYRIEGEEEMELVLVAAGFVPPRDEMHEAVHHEVAAQVAAALAPLRGQLDLLAPLALAQMDASLL